MVALRVRCTKLEEDNKAYHQVLTELKQVRLTCLSPFNRMEMDYSDYNLVLQENRLNSSLRANAEASRNQSVEASSRVSELELQTLQLEEELKQARADLHISHRENQVSLLNQQARFPIRISES